MKKKFKKFFIPLLLSISLLCAGAVCACSKTPSVSSAGVHIHTFGDWKETPATCTEAGERVRSCLSCGKMQREELPSLGHDYLPEERVESTCETAGHVLSRCSRCGNTETQPLPLGDHRWGQVRVLEEATCEGTGLRAAVCEVCGKREDEQVIPSLGHQWEETVLKTPSCTEEGSLKKECSRCRESTVESLPPNGHKWEEVRVLEEATCEEAGLRAAVCEVCGEREDEQVIPALGHNWKETFRKDATCTEQGLVRKECLRCNDSETETLGMLAHTYGDWQTERAPTCTEAGEDRRTCSACGAFETKETSALGHRYDTQFTVDEDPTEERAGSMSKHCLNPGCLSRSEVTPIEPLKNETTYSVSLRTTTGGSLPASSVSVSLCGEGGETAAQADGVDVQFTLRTGVYRVKVDMLPEGYALAREYEVTPTAPSVEIRVPASVIEKAPPADLKYRIGSVLYDMQVQVVELDPNADHKIYLSELFSNYKAVLINMYFSTCSACVSEMPAFVAAYNTPTAGGALYGEEVACVMLDAEAYDPNEETIEKIRKFKRQTNHYLGRYTAEREIPMIMIHDVWLRAYFSRAISNGYYPTTILVDCEGVIVSTNVGGLGKQGFINLMQKGIDRYETIRAWRVLEGLEEESGKTAPVRFDLAPDFVTVKRREL